jgi:hypothetical protein
MATSWKRAAAAAAGCRVSSAPRPSPAAKVNFAELAKKGRSRIRLQLQRRRQPLPHFQAGRRNPRRDFDVEIVEFTTISRGLPPAARVCWPRSIADSGGLSYKVDARHGREGIVGAPHQERDRHTRSRRRRLGDTPLLPRAGERMELTTRPPAGTPSRAAPCARPLPPDGRRRPIRHAGRHRTQVRRA